MTDAIIDAITAVFYLLLLAAIGLAIYSIGCILVSGL